MSTSHATRGRIGGLVTHARHDSRVITAPMQKAARSALDERQAKQHGLDPEAPDYAVRLARARTAHFTQLGLASAKARRKKAATKNR